jgi:hypothetical protein
MAVWASGRLFAVELAADLAPSPSPGLGVEFGRAGLESVRRRRVSENIEGWRLSRCTSCSLDPRQSGCSQPSGITWVETIRAQGWGLLPTNSGTLGTIIQIKHKQAIKTAPDVIGKCDANLVAVAKGPLPSYWRRGEPDKCGNLSSGACSDTRRLLVRG